MRWTPLALLPMALVVRAAIGCVGDSPTIITDAGSDVGASDAGSDTNATPCDAAIGTLPSAFGICGDAGGVLCLDTDAGFCASSAQACSIEQGATILCSNGTDCPGQRCCFTSSLSMQSCPWQPVTLSGSSCSATCAGGTFQVCQVNGDCFMGTCHPVASEFATFGVCE
jgi:hypothetical protein